VLNPSPEVDAVVDEIGVTVMQTISVSVVKQSCCVVVGHVYYLDSPALVGANYRVGIVPVKFQSRPTLVLGTY
jgi:hypothetical protein